MLRSTLVKKLNNHLGVQSIFVLLPVLLIVLYIVFYAIDLLTFISVVDYNDKITKRNFDEGLIKEVSDFSRNEDGTYTATIEGANEFVEEVAPKDHIYSVAILDKDWFVLTTKSGNRMYQTKCDFIDSVTHKDNNFVVTIGNKKVNAVSGGTIYDVVLTKDGQYAIEFKDKSIKKVNLDSLSTLSVIIRDRDTYRLRVKTSYSQTLKNIKLNFCTNLPSNNIYYNEITRSYVKNISSDFTKNFILGSNILVVFTSMLCYVLLLVFIRRTDNLVLLRNKNVLVLNMIAVSSLPLCILVTFILT